MQRPSLEQNSSRLRQLAIVCGAQLRPVTSLKPNLAGFVIDETEPDRPPNFGVQP